MTENSPSSSQFVPVQCSEDSLPGWPGWRAVREQSQTETSWTRFENIETVDVKINVEFADSAKQL